MPIVPFIFLVSVEVITENKVFTLYMFQNKGNHFRRNKQWSATLKPGLFIEKYLVAVFQQLL